MPSVTPRCPHSNLRTYDCVDLHGKRDFADTVKVRRLRGRAITLDYMDAPNVIRGTRCDPEVREGV